MNKQPNTPAGKPGKGSEASGKHEGLRHPIDEKQREQQRLDNVGLDDQGEAAEDELRDRRSSGAQRNTPAGRDQDARRH